MADDAAKPTGSYASKRDYSLPIDLVQELRNNKEENVQDLLDRYGVPTNALPVTTSAPVVNTPAATSAFMDALLKTPDARTENNALAFSTTNDKVVDLFKDLAPQGAPEELHGLLEAAWQQNSLDTLRVIWHARSIHEGKAMKDNTMLGSLAWLFHKHPRTFFENLHLLVDTECDRPDIRVKLENGVEELIPRGSVSHGYWKDLLNLLLLGVAGYLEQPLTYPDMLLAFKLGFTIPFSDRELLKDKKNKSRERRDMIYKAVAKDTKGEKWPEWYRKYQRATKPGKKEMLVARLNAALQTDKKFRALYILVARLFASALQKDRSITDKLATIPSEQQYQIASQLSLAAKWAPTPGHSHDKQLNIATAIAAIILPEIQDTVTSRVAYQKQYLQPLRETLQVLEVRMSSCRWNEINYSRVPSTAMANNKVHFFLHDEERYLNFLEDVNAGKKKISGATLFPHELLIDAYATQSSGIPPGLPLDTRSRVTKMIQKTVDLQWKSMVDSIKETASTSLSNCIAVVDVSGSMGIMNAHMDKESPAAIAVALALGILLAQLSAPPFNGAYITFSQDPAIKRIKENASLYEIAADLSDADWGYNTDFIKVFDLILGVADKHNLKKDEMIQKIFVFSDMQFDDANKGSQNWDATPHEELAEKFKDAGYELPELVYWNIQGAGIGARPGPVQADTPGTEILSGYSASLMKSFLGRAESEELAKAEEDNEDKEYDGVDVDVAKATREKKKETPADKLQKVLSHKSFAKLKVVD